ncbi:hypothetical protein WICANDRAFT_86237 [Wickerhamomyces anomalus NRRL Y-366-8]|uniref:Uncharacterized protein n=1 Tax=Wickerhamomyces anomalus (strain ATCC 58044 / CBS 1984 / NCYC 433 / NRRL Y-366-8) TaxID=683960 RepID=A0A1E3NUI1_WICAA|nr:uncharacterized protein WICANDRAFT_86237 [Wickerhamomyces anomalus NRRL Y-366-8]ODQ56786.1 hypothetical protein WICANDRAFT_86237 [Wickerhamomyces anomalus NRRL Y-366-8]
MQVKNQFLTKPGIVSDSMRNKVHRHMCRLVSRDQGLSATLGGVDFGGLGLQPTLFISAAHPI